MTGDTVATPAERLAEQLLAITAQYERELAATKAQTTDVHPAVLRVLQAATARREWKKIEADMPQIIADACAVERWNPQTVASVLGVTDSYVYRKLRDQRATEQ